jgi:uncharacterized protein YjbI with pentapeptide repeats
MSKTVVAVCAFIIGFACALLLTSGLGSVSASSQPMRNGLVPHNRMVVDGSRFSGNKQGIAIDGAIPEFRPLETTPIFNNVTISANESQDLDGLDCRGCTFNGAMMRYSGGAFNLENANFSGTTRLELSGAAANTVAFLKFMDGLAKGVAPKSFPQNKPVHKQAIAKNPLPKLDFTAPYIGAK